MQMHYAARRYNSGFWFAWLITLLAGLQPEATRAASVCPPALSEKVLDELEAIYTSPLYRRCDRASKRLIDVLTSRQGINPQFMSRLRVILGEITDGQLHAGNENSLHYETACIARAAELAAESGDPGLRSIFQNIVVMLTEHPTIGVVPQCTGFLVNGYLLTARHCFLPSSVEATTTIGGVELERLVIPPELRAVYVADPERQIALQLEQARHPDWYERNGAEGFGARSELLTEDWIALAVPEGAAGHQIDRVAKELDDARLLVLGVNFYALLARALTEGKSKLTAEDITASVSLEYGGKCRAFVVGEGFLLHNCDTEQATSGAPVFKVVGTDFELAGVHTGPELAVSLCPKDERYSIGRMLANGAVRPTSFVGEPGWGQSSRQQSAEPGDAEGGGTESLE